MSVVCSTFHCPPDVAIRQDWPTVRAILDYRNAEAAVDLFNRGAKGMAGLQAQPHLANLLLDMVRAQRGDATLAGLYDDMARRGEDD